ncbi:MAG: N-acetyltransferase [Pirellulales bacterium]|nr:N-acetyltransferase [Pirellulales bacterium]
MIVRAENPADRSAIYELHRQAFGGEDESRLVDSLRAHGYHRVSLVAEEAEQIVGHVLYSAIEIITPDARLPVLALAPVAVLPEWQNRRIGTRLIEQGLDQCRAGGHTIVLVVGHPPYYPRFGFSAELARQLACDYAGEAFMALELVPHAMRGLTGRVQYSPPFGDLE